MTYQAYCYYINISYISIFLILMIYFIYIHTIHWQSNTVSNYICMKNICDFLCFTVFTYNKLVIYVSACKYITPWISHNQKKKRYRKKIWLICPWKYKGCSSYININHMQFIKLIIKKWFPNHQKFNNSFNTKSIKLSYSRTTNLKNLITQNNSKVLNGALSKQ